MNDETKTKLTILQQLLSRTLDKKRTKAAEKRHKTGYRTARENLTDLVDADSFIEYGQLAAVEDEVQCQALFDKLAAKMYEIGQASEAAAHLEIDGVIDPADTRKVVLKTINSASISNRSHRQRRNFVDTW